MLDVRQIRSLTEQLAVIPAPSGREEKRSAFCLAYWRSVGLPAFADDVGNVILELGDVGGEPAALFMAHTDIVFDESVPLALRYDGDRLFCPGIGDDTVHVAMLLCAAEWMAKQKIPAGISFVFAANVCEEGEGNLRGCRALMERYAGRLREVISFDSYLHQLNHTAVGSMRYRITAKTSGGHSFRDFGNPNAIACMAQLVTKLNEQPIPTEGITTFNFGNISGGTTVNTIAPSACLLYEFRSDRHENLLQMEKQLEDALNDCKLLCDFSVESIGVRPCAHGVDKAAWANLIERAERAFDRLPKPSRYPASTDCNLPLSMGIPAVCIGLCEGAGAHTRDEYILPDSLADGARVLTALLRSYL